MPSAIHKLSLQLLTEEFSLALLDDDEDDPSKSVRTTFQAARARSTLVSVVWCCQLLSEFASFHLLVLNPTVLRRPPPLPLPFPRVASMSASSTSSSASALRNPGVVFSFHLFPAANPNSTSLSYSPVSLQTYTPVLASSHTPCSHAPYSSCCVHHVFVSALFTYAYACAYV